MDIDIALKEEQPAPLTTESNPEAKRDFERYYRSNCMSLMIIKHTIPEVFRNIELEEITHAKGFLDEIEKRFAKNDKVLIPIIDQEVNPKPQQENVEQLSIQDEVIVP
ncbi:uncharacterized protein LOC105786977 [Gossypium raimondii]|uniref:uncharacterized protein LOC105786977 n=1 Tax=Gossypium raimondii TaxID=29730 RepID=UPI00063A9AD8|nr:uncharacterized protein LOC105786977 [Gossypium raimondii]